MREDKSEDGGFRGREGGREGGRERRREGRREREREGGRPIVRKGSLDGVGEGEQGGSRVRASERGRDEWGAWVALHCLQRSLGGRLCAHAFIMTHALPCQLHAVSPPLPWRTMASTP